MAEARAGGGEGRARERDGQGKERTDEGRAAGKKHDIAKEGILCVLLKVFDVLGSPRDHVPRVEVVEGGHELLAFCDAQRRKRSGWPVAKVPLQRGAFAATPLASPSPCLAMDAKTAGQTRKPGARACNRYASSHEGCIGLLAPHNAWRWPIQPSRFGHPASACSRARFPPGLGSTSGH